MMHSFYAASGFCLTGQFYGYHPTLGYQVLSRSAKEPLHDFFMYRMHYLSSKQQCQSVVDKPHGNHCQGAYETAVHFVGECDRYASLRQEIWGSRTYIQMIFNI